MSNFLRRPSMLTSALAVVVLGMAVGFCSWAAKYPASASVSFDVEDMSQGTLQGIGALPLPEVEKRLNYLIQENSDTLESLDKVKDLDFILKIEPVVEAAKDQTMQYDKLFTAFTDEQLRALISVSLKPGNGW